MRTIEEIKRRLADLETGFEVEVKAPNGPCVITERALNLERIGSWIGAIKWTLNKDVDSPAVVHERPQGDDDIRVKPYPRGVVDLFWGDGLVRVIDEVVTARGDELSNPEAMKGVLLAWARAAAFEYLRHGQEIPLDDFLSGDRGLKVPEERE
jgi:hypothetical protein